MTKVEKSIHIIEFSGKKEDWNGWSEMFLARGGANQKEGVNKVLTKEEYYWAVTITANRKKVQEHYHINEVAFENLILSVDHKVQLEKLHFICKTKEFTERC